LNVRDLASLFCSLLLLTVLVSRRQLMSKQYMPGVQAAGEQDLRLFKLQQPYLPTMLDDDFPA
jgi:hypothetical protein